MPLGGEQGILVRRRLRALAAPLPGLSLSGSRLPNLASGPGAAERGVRWGAADREA